MTRDRIAAPEGFEAPWQAQLCALQAALAEAGVFSPTEWANVLGNKLRAGEPKADGSDYYARYLSALEEVLTAKAHTGTADIDTLAAAWQRAARATRHGQPIRLENDPGRQNNVES